MLIPPFPILILLIYMAAVYIRPLGCTIFPCTYFTAHLSVLYSTSMHTLIDKPCYYTGKGLVPKNLKLWIRVVHMLSI